MTRNEYYLQNKEHILQKSKEYYEANKKKKHEATNKLRRKYKENLVKSFGSVCHKCQQTFPACVFDFHHVDPHEKDFEIANLYSHKKQLEESKKCIMLCANCHRIEHSA
jgi:hypothetical protein